MKSSLHFELSSEILETSAPSICIPARFQVIVEYAASVCVPASVADTPEEAVREFLGQAPGCEEGEIALFDRSEQRVVASVKWKMSETEIGLRVSQRQNVFHDWQLALIAKEKQRHRVVTAASEIHAEISRTRTSPRRMTTVESYTGSSIHPGLLSAVPLIKGCSSGFRDLTVSSLRIHLHSRTRRQQPNS